MKQVLTGLLCLLFAVNSFGQNPELLPDPSLSNPTAASLTKYGNIPVGHQTGVPNIGIAISTVQDGPLSLPISLSYHASGHKVEDVASWVGLGWSLNAGGVISRVVNGGPDEGKYVDGDATSGIAGHGWYKNYGLHSYFVNCSNEPGDSQFFVCGGSVPCQGGNTSNSCGNIMKDAANGYVDTAPDMFNFNVNGHSGKFYFKADRTVELQPKQDLVIEPNFQNNKFVSFKIIAPDGTEYIFSEEEKIYSDPLGSGTNITFYSTSSWHLTRIQSAYGGHHIDLSYVNEDFSYTNRNKHVVSDCSGDLVYAPFHASLTSIKGKRLSQITTSEGNQKIIFHANTNRVDLSRFGAGFSVNNQAKRLDFIEVQKNSWKTFYDFTYDYYGSTSGSYYLNSQYPAYFQNYLADIDKKRLKLQQVQQRSSTGTTLPPHIFTYNTTVLPRRFSLGRDAWGYYNGANSNKGLIPAFDAGNECPQFSSGGYSNRDVNLSSSKAGILTTIQYPTGGKTIFNYENHAHNGVSVGGLRVSSISDYDPVTNTNNVRNINYIQSEMHTPMPSEEGYVMVVPPYVNNGNVACNPNYITSELFPHLYGSTQGSHITYTIVEESRTGAGKTIFEYTPSALNYPQNTAPRIPVQADVTAGHLIESTSENEAGVEVASSSNLYLNDDVSTINAFAVANYYCDEPNRTSMNAWTPYTITTSRNLLKKTTSVKDGVTTITDFTYYPTHNNVKSESVLNSDGDIFKTEYKYAVELDPTLTTKNIINIPLETTTSIGGNETGGHKLEYANFGGKRLLNKVYRKKNEGSLGLDLYQLATKYNSRAQILSSTRNHDITKSVIWRSEGDVPIALATNAETNEIAYSGFEQDLNTTAVNGGWEIEGAEPNAFAGIEGKTGRRYLLLGKVYNTFPGGGPRGGGGGFPYQYRPSPEGYDHDDMVSTSISIKKQYPAAGTYVVSYWYKYAPIRINGVIPPGDTYSNNWKYGEYKITLNAWSTLTVTASANSTQLDELRMMPSDAQMITYNYEPNTIQPISINDLNSKATKYKYDEFLRLKNVIDHNGNYISATTYNYQLSSGGEIVNRIANYTAQIAGLTANSISSKFNPITTTTRHMSYMDGLGRPIQTIGIKTSPSAKDVISFNEYDAQGREWKSFLPYTYTSSGGLYTPLSTAKSRQQSFLNGLYGSTDKDFGYTENKFELSPLNRVAEQSQPGSTYQNNSGHSSTSSYRGNNANEVWNFNNWTWFPANSLNVLESRDGNRTGTTNASYTYTYTDKVGRHIATNVAGRFTYNVYDDYKKGRLAYVISPEESKLSSRSGHNWASFKAAYAGKIYQYTYNKLNQIITKNIPGQGATSIYYDRLDRVVMTKDANGLKSITKYDILSRPVLTGVYTGTALPSNGNGLYESKTTSGNGYTTYGSFPTSGAIIHSASYYDTYSYPSVKPKVANTAMKVYSLVQSCRGMATGSRTGVLSASSNTATPTKYMVSSVYYDEYGRPNYSHADNHVGYGYDKMWTEYDFDGDVMETKHIQNAHGTTTTKLDRFTYDHARRPLNHYVKIGSNTEYLLSQKSYKETDQLNYTRLGNNAQQIDYLYNINGWMTRINNPSSLGSDLFAQELKYHDAATNKQYNGNIASLQWRNSGQTAITESFTYDNLNRLLGSGTTGTNQGTTYGYDDNGNLDDLTRMNGSSIIDDLNYTYNSLGQLSQLQEVESLTQGYTSNSSNATYAYDANGNATYASNKNLTISYNHFNLPKKFNLGSNQIDITYDASGSKLKKTTNASLSKDYVEGYEYENNVLKKIYHEDGWIEMNGTTPTYKFFIKDHLGNTRVTFRVNGSGVAVKEGVHAYYPFGMEKSISGGMTGGQDYLYNGKELNTDFGLDMLDYGARWYDPSIARWHSVDPLAEKGFALSPFNYVNNNPIRYLDPDGRWFNDSNEKRAARFEKKINKRITKLNKRIQKSEGDRKTDLTARVEELGGSLTDISDMRSNEGLEFRFAKAEKPATAPIDSDGAVIEIGYDGTMGSLVHEARHGGQVARGELGFDKGKDGGFVPNSKFGVADEISGYRAQYAYNGKLDVAAYLNITNAATLIHWQKNPSIGRLVANKISDINAKYINSIGEGTVLVNQVHLYPKQFTKPKEWNEN